MNQRKQLIEDVTTVLDEELSDVANLLGKDRVREIAEAALAVFEGAGSFFPVPSDVQEAAHTDEEREARGTSLYNLACDEGLRRFDGDTARAGAFAVGAEWGSHRTVQGEPSDAQVHAVAVQIDPEAWEPGQFYAAFSTARDVSLVRARAALRAAAETGGARPTVYITLRDSETPHNTLSGPIDMVLDTHLASTWRLDSVRIGGGA